MNKTLLIFRREFLKTVKRTGFIILTLSLPVLALLGIGIFRIASGVAKPPAEVTKVGYIDEVGGFNQFTTQGNINLVLYDSTQAATQALVAKDVTEYFVIPPDFISSGRINVYITHQELTPSPAVTAAITSFVSSNLLAGKVSDGHSQGTGAAHTHHHHAHLERRSGAAAGRILQLHHSIHF